MAFLRAMNVGGRRVTNDELCACFGRMGFVGASGFLASGNVIFEADDRSGLLLGADIEAGLLRELGYAVPTFVRTAGEVAEIASRRPFPPIATPSGCGNPQVALLRSEPTAPERTDALALATDDDLLAIVGRELHWLPEGTMSDAELDLKALAEILGPMTIRTHRTIDRLATKLADRAL